LTEPLPRYTGVYGVSFQGPRISNSAKVSRDKLLKSPRGKNATYYRDVGIPSGSQGPTVASYRMVYGIASSELMIMKKEVAVTQMSSYQAHSLLM